MGFLKKPGDTSDTHNLWQFDELERGKSDIF
jgi:hypothetical protein